MKLGDKKAITEDFKERGFDCLIALDGEGKQCNFTKDGYEDGRQLAKFLKKKLVTVNFMLLYPFIGIIAKFQEMTQKVDFKILIGKNGLMAF
ncbi:hypothetical protein A3L04_10240 [Thermococcus chitonophagus]|uniref:Uncharacterized protein n=2 Tax=Thermococcus chitonophagus TaxID=54262 RepID=A0A2Z2NDD4_9EURY|nr:hypothetical protein A3L04_10240 [Thermococcus chitonophagus]